MREFVAMLALGAALVCGCSEDADAGHCYSARSGVSSYSSARFARAPLYDYEVVEFVRVPVERVRSYDLASVERYELEALRRRERARQVESYDVDSREVRRQVSRERVRREREPLRRRGSARSVERGVERSSSNY